MGKHRLLYLDSAAELVKLLLLLLQAISCYACLDCDTAWTATECNSVSEDCTSRFSQ